MIDTLKIFEMLRDGGFDERQSKVLVNAFRENIDDRQFATKQDVQLLKQDIQLVKQDIQLLKQDIELLKRDLTIRLGAMQIVLVGAPAVLMKLL